jgi:hypothetical protein
VLAILLSFVLTIAVTLGLGLGYDPVSAFAMTGTGIVIVLVAIYILMNVACIGYFARAANRGGHGWNPFLHLIVPVLGIAAFVPAWLTSAGIRVFSFVVPLTAPASYMAQGVAGFMVLGLIYLGYLYARHPQRVTEVGLVHLDEPTAEAGAATSPGSLGSAGDHEPAGVLDVVAMRLGQVVHGGGDVRAAPYHGHLARLLAPLLVRLPQRPDQLGIPVIQHPLRDGPLEPPAAEVIPPVVMGVGLVHVRQPQRAAVTAQRPQDDRPGDVGGPLHDLVARRSRGITRVMLPLHGNAEPLKVQGGYLVDKLVEAELRHPRLGRGVTGRRPLRHDEVALPRPGGNLAEELRLPDVHHREQDEPQWRLPPLQRDDG